MYGQHFTRVTAATHYSSIGSIYELQTTSIVHMHRGLVQAAQRNIARKLLYIHVYAQMEDRTHLILFLNTEIMNFT